MVDTERTEEFKISGDQLLGKVKELIAAGNVRRILIKREGEVILEIPLNAGLAVTAVTTVLAPVLVAVGAIAAVLTQVTLVVEREDEGYPAAQAEESQTPGADVPAASEPPSH